MLLREMLQAKRRQQAAHLQIIQRDNTCGRHHVRRPLHRLYLLTRLGQRVCELPER